MNKTLLTAALVIVGGASLFAGDIFRFRGENSQGMYMEEKGLMKSWPQGGLTPKWTYTGLGEGWTSPIKVGNRLYISGSDMNSNPKKEKVVCLDLDGKLIWQTPTGVRWERSFPGARSTPTYVPGEKEGEGRLVVTTGPGELYCLNAADGKILWQKNIANEYGSKFGMWAMAECPVVKDGTVMWEDNYASTTGAQGRGGINCNTPMVKDNRFYVSAGYDQGGVLYELNEDGKGVKVVWKNKNLDPHHDCTVLIDGKLYGSNWVGNDRGNWMCVDWETGKTIYETPWERLGKGCVIYADGLMYIYEEKRGTLGLLKPGDKFEVVSSFQINFGNKEHWAHPVICDGVLYVRHGDALAAFDIKAK